MDISKNQWRSTGGETLFSTLLGEDAKQKRHHTMFAYKKMGIKKQQLSVPSVHTRVRNSDFVGFHF